MGQIGVLRKNYIIFIIDLNNIYLPDQSVYIVKKFFTINSILAYSQFIKFRVARTFKYIFKILIVFLIYKHTAGMAHVHVVGGVSTHWGLELYFVRLEFNIITHVIWPSESEYDIKINLESPKNRIRFLNFEPPSK